MPKSEDLVELDPADVEVISQRAISLALAEARKVRFGQLNQDLYWWKIANPAEAVRVELPELKHRYMAAAQQQIHPAYATDHGLKDILHALSLYFVQSADFEQVKAGYSLRKGLMLVGTPGVGKSSMMRVWGQLNPRQRFGVKSCLEVAKAFTMNGFDGLEPWCNPHPSGVCFDDLGTENLTGKNFGNETSPMAAVLLARYDMFQAGEIQGHHTHMTTNLTWDALKPYGDRVLDRLREMFNVILFPPTAPSRRQ